MSVLVEALSLVVPRLALDLAWPGGADAFLRGLCVPDTPARQLCADDRLASVSFFTPEQAEAVAAQLRARGLVEVDGDAFVDFAFVDQHHGPAMPCPWLRWRWHPDGYTYAWPADADTPGEMAAPADWTPEQSRRLTRADVRDEPGRMLRLAADADTGLETWLDFATGRMSRGLPHRPNDLPTDDPSATAPVPDDPTASRILAAVDATLRAEGYTVAEADAQSRQLRFGGRHADYLLRLWADDASGLLVCHVVLPVRAPKARRAAVAELVARVNYELPVGGFDLDVRDGELRFRYGADVEGESLDGRLIANMIRTALNACEWQLETLLAVAFGGRSPSDARAAREASSDGDEAGGGPDGPPDDPPDGGGDDGDAELARIIAELAAEHGLGGSGGQAAADSSRTPRER